MTVVACGCLFQTYNKKGAVEVSRLDREHPEVGTNAMEAAAAVIFYTNLKFLLLLFVLAFWVLPAILPSTLVYVLSVSAPALLLYVDAVNIIKL